VADQVIATDDGNPTSTMVGCTSAGRYLAASVAWRLKRMGDRRSTKDAGLFNASLCHHQVTCRSAPFARAD